MAGVTESFFNLAGDYVNEPSGDWIAIVTCHNIATVCTVETASVV
jgi:hypothetical protein